MSYSESRQEFDLYSENFSLIGTQTLTLRSSLENYPSVSIEQSVDILVRDPCRNPFYIGALSDDYFIEYVYGSDPVDLIIDNFKVDPPVCPITYECQSA